MSLTWVTPTDLLDLSRVESVQIIARPAGRRVRVQTTSGDTLFFDVPMPHPPHRLTAGDADKAAADWVIVHLRVPREDDQ